MTLDEERGSGILYGVSKEEKVALAIVKLYRNPEAYTRAWSWAHLIANVVGVASTAAAVYLAVLGSWSPLAVAAAAFVSGLSLGIAVFAGSAVATTPVPMRITELKAKARNGEQ